MEQALKDAKEGAQRDRARYQKEVERIKEAMKQKQAAYSRKGAQAHIGELCFAVPAFSSFLLVKIPNICCRYFSEYDHEMLKSVIS